MDRQSFRFAFGVVAVEIVLALLFFMFISLPGSSDVQQTLTIWLLFIIAPVSGALLVVAGVLYCTDWVNRRDDPRHQKPPPDPP
jgi:hypothetical protein